MVVVVFLMPHGAISRVYFDFDLRVEIIFAFALSNICGLTTNRNR
jgi:hypothetical protein